jgi:hypothetical protein
MSRRSVVNRVTIIKSRNMSRRSGMPRLEIIQSGKYVKEVRGD